MDWPGWFGTAEVGRDAFMEASEIGKLGNFSSWAKPEFVGDRVRVVEAEDGGESHHVADFKKVVPLVTL